MVDKLTLNDKKIGQFTISKSGENRIMINLPNQYPVPLGNRQSIAIANLLDYTFDLQEVLAIEICTCDHLILPDNDLNNLNLHDEDCEFLEVIKEIKKQ